MFRRELCVLGRAMNILSVRIWKMHVVRVFASVLFLDARLVLVPARKKQGNHQGQKSRGAKGRLRLA